MEETDVFINFIYLASSSWIADKKLINKGNNKITELRTILQRESQNS